MTDNEIKKALECCNDYSYCVKCPFHKHGECCDVNLYELALNLINRYEAKIEALETDNAQLKADHEDLKQQFHFLDMECSRLEKAEDENTAEIERLREYEEIRPVGCPNCHRGNFSNSKYCTHCGTQLHGKKKDVRAEAIKEFAERLKEVEAIEAWNRRAE